jgi:transglutaminase-like putative cysteine protease
MNDKSEKGRILQIFRDGRRNKRLLLQQLPAGAKGNLETLFVMKQIVLADSKENDLKNYAMREIIGLDKKTLAEKVKAAFLYCRDQILYKPEKDGLETVADLWSCIYALDPDHATGDCAIKSIVLATCFSYLGLKPRFVAIRQIKDADYFNHVFVECDIDGKTIVYDPTPPESREGDELKSFSRLIYRIF